MPSLSSTPSESLLNRIWGVFTRIISKMLTAFRWLKVRLGSKTTTTMTSSHTSKSSPEATIHPCTGACINPGGEPSLRARFTEAVNKVELFRKYQVGSSLAVHANSVISSLQHAKQQYSNHPLSVKSLENLEKRILEFEKALQSEIEFQTSHLTSILSEKIVALQLKVNNLSEDSEKQKMNKQLQDMQTALKKENASIVGLSGSDQELAYTSEARRCFITQLSFQIETISCDIEKTEQIQEVNQQLDQIQAEANKRKEQIEADERQRAEALRLRREENQKQLEKQLEEISRKKNERLEKNQKQMAQLQLETYRNNMWRKCMDIKNIKLLPSIGMKRYLYQKALDLRWEEICQAEEKFNLAKTKEEIDAAVHEYVMIQQRGELNYYHQNAQDYNKVIQGTPEPYLDHQSPEEAMQQYPAFANAFAKHKKLLDAATMQMLDPSTSIEKRKMARVSHLALCSFFPSHFSPKTWCEPTEEEFLIEMRKSEAREAELQAQSEAQQAKRKAESEAREAKWKAKSEAREAKWKAESEARETKNKEKREERSKSSRPKGS